MVPNKSTDQYILIYRALLRDVQTTHSEVFSPTALRKTDCKVCKRITAEGLGFLTKTLPRLGKTLDRALTGEVPLDSTVSGFEPMKRSKLPKFLGELFQCIFSHDGWILPTPCVKCIKTLRQLLFVFYKLELPNDERQEQKVLEKFIKTDQELGSWNFLFSEIGKKIDADPHRLRQYDERERIVRSARILLSEVFAEFDPTDIHPRHGPGAVSTKERLSGKYTFRSVSPRILETYPLDAFFYASLGHVCDELGKQIKCDSHCENCKEVCSPQLRENSARVILVPKDSRGPRLISCEPLEFQWVQQGLGSAIVRRLEHHPLTRWSLHFSDQTPNQCGASLGSITGGYATLDLNEASDRVSTELVRLLFPEPLCSALLNCRSLSTVLPDGSTLKLNKYAPMGSALCFPVLATVCWAVLAVGLQDAGVPPCSQTNRKTNRFRLREDILVYGDDIIVETAQAEHAIRILESFGLVINRDKSCVSGFFRESCGRDSFKGVNVTPVRIRTVWDHHRRPEVYTSYIAYANSFYGLNFHCTYDSIASALLEIYQEIPDKQMNHGSYRDSVPSLMEVPEANLPKTKRGNKALHKAEYRVWTLRTPKVRQVIGGWKMLLRFFAESTVQTPLDVGQDMPRRCGVSDSLCREPFSVSQYTERKTSYLVKRWR